MADAEEQPPPAEGEAEGEEGAAGEEEWEEEHGEMEGVQMQPTKPAKRAKKKARTKKKPQKPSYVWMPRPLPAKKPSFSPCPHLFFGLPVPKRKGLSHEAYIEMLAQPRQEPWKEEADPTLIRFKRRPMSQRMLELSIPRRPYVEAQCEELAGILGPERMKRLQKMLGLHIKMSQSSKKEKKKKETGSRKNK